MSEHPTKANVEQANNPAEDAYEKFHAAIEKSAAMFIDDFAGDIDDEQRAELHQQVVEHMSNIRAPQEEMVKAYEEVIAGIKEYAHQHAQAARLDAAPNDKKTHTANASKELVPYDADHAHAQQEGVAHQEIDASNNETAPRPEGVPTTAEVEEMADDIENSKGKYTVRQKARMVLGLPSLAVASIITRGNSFTRKEGESEEKYDKRMKRHKWSLPLAAAGVVGYFGYKVFANWKGFDTGEQHGMIGNGGGAGGNNHDPADLNKDGVVDPTEMARDHGFGYDFANDPFNDTEKTGVHNFGDALAANEASGEKAPGLSDLIGERWVKSPEQFATAAAEMGLDGFKTDNIEEMAEKLKTDPAFYEKSYTQLTDIINNPETKFSNGTLEPGTYGSYYETAVDQDGVISYDNNINEVGTTIKIEYKDAEGNWKTVEFKRECGGQIIHRNPAVEAAPASVYTPQGQGEGYQPAAYTQPQGQGGGETPNNPGNPNPPSEEPPTEQPPTGEPPTEEPPTLPPTEEPPTEEPPTLAPKSSDPKDYEHIEDAPKAEFGGWAPPAQTDPTPDTVTGQQPGSEIGGGQTGGQAPGAEDTTPAEEQQREEQPPATGATDETNPGTETNNPF